MDSTHKLTSGQEAYSEFCLLSFAGKTSRVKVQGCRVDSYVCFNFYFFAEMSDGYTSTKGQAGILIEIK